MVTFMVVVVAAFLMGAMVGAWIVMDLSQASGSVAPNRRRDTGGRAKVPSPVPQSCGVVDVRLGRTKEDGAL